MTCLSPPSPLCPLLMCYSHLQSTHNCSFPNHSGGSNDQHSTLNSQNLMLIKMYPLLGFHQMALFTVALCIYFLSGTSCINQRTALYDLCMQVFITVIHALSSWALPQFSLALLFNKNPPKVVGIYVGFVGILHIFALAKINNIML